MMDAGRRLAASPGAAPGFGSYHRAPSRRRWSGRAVARLLLRELLRAFAALGEPVVVALDEALERRRGRRIAALGIHRDAVRSSHGHFVKASGLRCFSLMLLAPVPWASRLRAFPLFTALAPSERWARGRGARHKELTDRARQFAPATGPPVAGPARGRRRDAALHHQAS